MYLGTIIDPPGKPQEVLYFMGTGGVCNCTQVHVPSPSPALWGLMVDYNHIAYRLLLPKDVCDL